MRTIFGDCTVRFDGKRTRRLRGRLLVVIKPDDTVLVHDVDGYQPVAWLTRPASLALTRGPTRVLATEGEQTLSVEFEDATVRTLDATVAGQPVGTCRCGGELVRSNGVVCLDCGEQFPLPGDATVLDSTSACGLPHFRVERGDVFELCLDRDCASLDDAVAERFDGVWNCPECSGTLGIERRRTLVASCEGAPDCDAAFVVPTGTVDGECDCGLPAFETGSGRRCLDATCERY